MSDWAVDLRGLRKVYSGRVEALRGVDLQVPRGSVFGLLGPNGAGKSTLVKILMTLIRKTSGEGLLLGEQVGHKATLARVGYLPEHARFPDYLTGEQVVKMMAGLAGVPAKATRERTGTLLERVGLSQWKTKRLRSYSKGMKQRIGLAQALVNDPDLIFLDEPTDGVDPAGRREIRLLLQELSREGKTIFVNSHLLSELESFCDSVAILSKGEVKMSGSLKDLTGRKVSYRLTCQSVEPATKALVEGEGRRWQENELIVEEASATAVMPIVDKLRERGVILEGMRKEAISLEDLFLEAVGHDGPGGAVAGKGGQS
ncbi:MAG: ABC transporter ATP-binding protein [Verrucomicrobiota bacterium JB023]|nr:ABC transporter ATP-binding protein [Verrucomicrobiota bacterium JB023]